LADIPITKCDDGQKNIGCVHNAQAKPTK
jgi:hypothetical protein